MSFNSCRTLGSDSMCLLRVVVTSIQFVYNATADQFSKYGPGPNCSVTLLEIMFSLHLSLARTFYMKHKPLTVLKTVLKHFCLEKLSYDEYRLLFCYIVTY